LISTWHFSLRIVFPIIWLADVACDNMYYRIGRWSFKSKRLNKIIDESKFLSGHLDLMKKLWTNHPIKTMIFGKNAYLISIVIIASAGKVKMPYLHFLKYSMPVSFIQPSILLFVGYYLWDWYKLAANYMQYPGIAIAIIFVLIVIFYRKISKHITKDFETEKVQ
jgi:membrane protein DedA with SNARE-associated domain